MLMIDDPELEDFIQDEMARTGRAPNEVLRQYLPTPLPVADEPAAVSAAEQARRTAVIHEVQAQAARLPVFDDRPMDELLGYDDDGLPTYKNDRR